MQSKKSKAAWQDGGWGKKRPSLRAYRSAPMLALCAKAHRKHATPFLLLWVCAGI